MLGGFCLIDCERLEIEEAGFTGRFGKGSSAEGRRRGGDYSALLCLNTSLICSHRIIAWYILFMEEEISPSQPLLLDIYSQSQILLPHDEPSLFILYLSSPLPTII
jgi:hypothetical protein